MAKRVLYELVDDIDGKPADETVRFALDGVQYEIDLTPKEADAFRKKLAPYTEKGRQVGGRRGGLRRKASGGPTTKEIREWARGQGFQVPERGRIPNEIVEKFEEAQSA